MQPQQDLTQDLDDAVFEKGFEQAALEMDQMMGQAEADIHSIAGATAKTQHPQQQQETKPLHHPTTDQPLSDLAYDNAQRGPIGSDLIIEENQSKNT